MVGLAALGTTVKAGTCLEWPMGAAVEGTVSVVILAAAMDISPRTYLEKPMREPVVGPVEGWVGWQSVVDVIQGEIQ